MTRKLTLLGPLVFILAAAHAVFAWMHRDLRPVLEVLTPPPGHLAGTVAAAGDNQFIYRIWALDLQNAGDTGGRATPMHDYNYDLVIGWLETLQALDPRAHQHAHLAANYFSLTPNLADVRRIVAFVADDWALYPAEKWVWMVRGVEIATARLKDREYALALSQRLAAYDLPAISFIIMSLPAIFLEKLGRYAEARVALNEALQKRADTVTVDERAWAEDFILRLPKD